MTDLGPAHANAPAVTNPGLAAFVDAARRQPSPTLQATAEAVHHGWQQVRARRVRGLAVGCTLAAGLAIFVGIGNRPSVAPALPSGSSPVAEAATDLATDVAHSGRDAAPHHPEVHTAHPGVIALAAGVTVDAVVDGSPVPVVHGAHVLELISGGYQVSVDKGSDTPLTIRIGASSVELERGVVLILLTGATPEVALTSGAGTWIDADGTRHPLALPEEQAQPTEASAQELARRADQLAADGDGEGAIRTLRRLVQRHPQAAASRSGLLDLARLLRASGQVDQARCAYELYLERWPYSQLRDEIDRAHTKLGAGPRCRGLRPL